MLKGLGGSLFSGVKPQGVGPKICTHVTNPYEAMKFDFDGPPQSYPSKPLSPKP